MKQESSSFMPAPLILTPLARTLDFRGEEDTRYELTDRPERNYALPIAYPRLVGQYGSSRQSYSSGSQGYGCCRAA